MRHFSNWTIVSHRQVWTDLSVIDQPCCALLRDVQNQRTALGEYQGAAEGVHPSERPMPSQRLKFRCGVLRGSCTRQKAARTRPVDSAAGGLDGAPACGEGVPCVRQPAETGGPVPCDPGIRYHFTAARSLGLAGRERNVADESEDVERRTELYTCVGGASWRWREAEPPFREGVGR
ncbi:uncharacterized protein N7515_007816 [Penicillium bovifimosum]|uniref:Uncharacterized protein n=1 Tax=Penicillium bovifimosum TaxID=126998 RepID=A0A9W9GLW2_9EURO|nr:uncharacterized protein N7515_007816 [Penicillium bovifimosum]KAJ5123991.1 hypothetical protein N7515_007816 [Penicillium bovifimosum]